MHPPLLHPRPGRGLHTAALLAAGLVFCLSLPFLLGSRLSEGGASVLDRWRAGQPLQPSPHGTPDLGWAQEHLLQGSQAEEAHLHPKHVTAPAAPALHPRLQWGEPAGRRAGPPPANASGTLGTRPARLAASPGSSEAVPQPQVSSHSPGAAALGGAQAAGGADAAGPSALQARSRFVGTVEQRVSGLGPPLDPVTLHGGWQLTRAAWERAARHPNATVLSAHAPRVLLVRGFLSPSEVEHLVTLAAGDLERSQVVADGQTQRDIRTSSGAWLTGSKRDAKVLAIQHRIHALLGIPEEFGESIHVLRYTQSQRYDAHTDYCAVASGQPGDRKACRGLLERAGGPACGPGAGGITCGDRLASLLVYLKSPTKGGATVFPKSRPAALPSMTAAAGSTLGKVPPFHPNKDDLHTGPAEASASAARSAAGGGGAAGAGTGGAGARAADGAAGGTAKALQQAQQQHSAAGEIAYGGMDLLDLSWEERWKNSFLDFGDTQQGRPSAQQGTSAHQGQGASGKEGAGKGGGTDSGDAHLAAAAVREALAGAQAAAGAAGQHGFKERDPEGGVAAGALQQAAGQQAVSKTGALLRRELAQAEGGVAPRPAPSYCDERAGLLRVLPQPGDALLWWNYAPREAPPEGQDPGAVLEVELDPTSLHTGCPVLEGEKWVATRWVRSAEFH